MSLWQSKQHAASLLLVFVSVLACACEERSSAVVPVGSASANELCLVQLRAEYFEIVRLDGTTRSLRVHDTDWLGTGTVSPNGAFIVVTTAKGLAGLSLSGAELWRLDDVAVSGTLAVDADGTKVAFGSADQRLAIYDIRTHQVISLKTVGRNPSWSSDGKRLAYDDGTQSYIREEGIYPPVRLGQGTEPSWLPNGTGLAVRVARERVDLVDVQTHARQVLISDSRRISVPTWSPDGRWMMFTRQGSRHWWSKSEWTGSEPSQIIVRDTRTGTQASIGEFYKANPGHYSWVASPQLCQARTAER